jgi:phosphatidylserine decarboxylase
LDSFAHAGKPAGDRQLAGMLARVAAMIGIAPEGAAISLGTGAAGVLVLAIGLHWLGLAMLAVALAIGAFFRDPNRTPPARNGVVLSGADGKVTDVGQGAPSGIEGNFRRVSVFMSPLNVHVNRAPIGGEVVSLQHISGEFRAAFSDHASEHNERNLIALDDAAGARHAMVQVAGYLARRIVCRLRNRDKIQAGQRIGLIMFGSRVDHFMPLQYRVAVRVGDRVRAGESVIGELTPGEPVPKAEPLQ